MTPLAALAGKMRRPQLQQLPAPPGGPRTCNRAMDHAVEAIPLRGVLQHQPLGIAVQTGL